MDKTTAVRTVRATFKAAFDKLRFRNFINELCNGFDEGKARLMSVPDAFAPHVKSCQRLGTFESAEGEKADVLVVQLTDSFKLERSRTALRDFVAHKLKRGDSYKEAGLVAFVAPDAQSWRFSFVRMDYATRRDPDTGKIKLEERLTPARRHSYLVGLNEECHTAQSRFLALLQNTTDRPTLAQIEAAFSVESVTKEFFAEYVRLFEATHAALLALIEKDPILRADFEARHVNSADFTKKLLGQIVFLTFVQKKGWLGVHKGGQWGDGPRHFLRQLATRAIENQQNLFNDVLEPLFYDTLATDRGAAAWCEPFQCRIPFLNGGLFEPLAGYDWKNTHITLPNSLFTNTDANKAGDTGTGILDVFDRYNFTVMEDEPLEKEVAIDPEMLGRVFENLIEENRRKGLGAFYTPREIVHYMCQESLINYLDTGLNHGLQPIGIAQLQLHTTPPLFVDSDESPAPATGQLEFLEPASQVLVPRADLAQWIAQSEQFAHYAAAIAAGTHGEHYPKPSAAIRRYAVEIDALLRDITACDPAVGSGAFLVGMMNEIVRARLALTPYFTDQAERSAYHFKRRAIEHSLYGVDIDAGAVEIAKLRLWLSLVVDVEDVQTIRPLPNLDYKIVVGNSLLGVEKTLFNQDAFKKLELLKPQFFNASDRVKKLGFKKQINELIYSLTQGREVFDYEIYFSEVFHAKGGFDVVIANPPYLRVQGVQETQPELIPFYKKTYSAAQGSFDLYGLFIERGYRLLHPQGHLSYIVPHKFFQATFAKGLRELLNQAKALQQIVRFGAAQIFESATTYTCLLFLSQVKQSSFTLHEVNNLNGDDRVLSAIQRGLTHDGYESARQSQPTTDDWDFHIGQGGLLLEKLAQQGVTLGDITRKIFQGIATSADKIYVLRLLREDGEVLTCYSKQLEAEIHIERGLVKPFLMGKNVHRYEPPDVKNVVIFPYEIKDGSASLMIQSKIKKDFPLGWKYLIKTRVDLEAREKNRMIGENFYAYIYPKNLTEFESIKILTPEIASGCQLTVDSEGTLYHTTKVYSFVFNQKVSNDPMYLLGVMNSPVLWYFLKSTGYVLRGGYYTFKTDYLRPFPIACSLSKKPPTATQESEIVALVKTRLALGKTSEENTVEIEKVENLINAAVYCLYNLTPAEIALVEAAR
ncbi:MAG: Eco57I restriction-modification methylase domain-containing protein [Rhodoferax sp.]|nr:Eco57I restriction-modification methylase domain-containing protein [Rhodoferax sp.]